MSHKHTTLLLYASLLLNVLLFAAVLQKDAAVTTKPVEEDSSSSASLEDDIVYESGKSYPLMRIVDGDTLTVGFNGRTEYVRLIGVDASEENDPGGPECYAQEATQHLRELARTGTVVLHFDESQGTRDKYGRILAYVELPDGTDLGEQMLRDGYVQEYTYDQPYNRLATYKSAELYAAEQQYGLWATDACKN